MSHLKGATRRVAIDYDGVIADTNQIKSAWISEHLKLRVSPWRCDRTSCVPIIGLDAYNRMSETVYGLEATMRANPVVGAVRGMRDLRPEWNLFCITNRDRQRTRWAEERLRELGLLDDLEEVLSSYSTTKMEIVRRIDAVALFDDDLRHLRKPAARSIRKHHYAPYLRVRLQREGDIIHSRTWRAFVDSLTRSSLT